MATTDYDNWFDQLSVEVIERIVLNLPAKDVIEFGTCSRRFNSITNNERIWEKLVRRDYDIDLKRDTEDDDSYLHSAKQFYLKILSKYGCLLTNIFHRKNFTYYGGIIKVVYHHFALYILELEPPMFPDVTKGLQPQIICKIGLSQCDEDVEDGQSEEHITHNVKVLIEQDTTDFGEIQKIDMVRVGLNNKSNPFRIISTPSSLPFMKDLRGEISSWFELDSGPRVPEGIIRIQEFAKRFGLMQSMAFEKFSDRIEFLNQGIQVCEVLPLERSISSPPLLFCPISPGVFKGTYGPHGIEIIRLEYRSMPSVENRCDAFIVGEKLYGDRNVPSYQITFKGYLNRPMTLSKEDQYEISKIRRCMKGESQREEETLPTKDTKPNVQPFVLPMNCECEYPLESSDLFRMVKWRFEGSCQIASDLYQNPEWIDGNLVIFSEDIFGVIFMAEEHGFNSLTIYHRVQEDLASVHYEDVFKDLPRAVISKKFNL